jgi:S1-C subfamily serine protease
MIRPVHACLAILIASLSWSEACAQRLIDFEPAAKKLRDATVTVSVTEKATAAKAGATTTVCSGVIVGPGLLVSSINATMADTIRVSDTTGVRHPATLNVVDHFTGLSLLRAPELTGEPIAVEAELPKTGAWIISAAAWGQSEPIVTHGIVSSTQRTRRSTPSPPLIQCDMRTLETSSGAAIVGPSGKLSGIVVATDVAGAAQPGTFAVPARHVQRLLRARQPGQLVVLKRKRPSVGLILSMGDQPEQVIVERVVRDGPADKVGVQAGDRVVSVDGQRIRWVYEALQPVLQRQPGDSLKMVVVRDDQKIPLELVLGGGITLPAGSNLDSLGGNARRLSVSRVGENEFAVHDNHGSVRSLRFDENGADVTKTEPQPIDVLQKAVDRYGRAIVTMRDELQQRDQEQRAALKRISDLHEEVDTLRQQLGQREAAK